MRSSLPPATNLHNVTCIVVPKMDLLIPYIPSNVLIPAILSCLCNVASTTTTYYIPTPTTQPPPQPYALPLPTSTSLDGDIMQYGFHLLLSYTLATDSIAFLSTLSTSYMIWKNLILSALSSADISVRMIVAHYIHAIVTKINDTGINHDKQEVKHMTLWYTMYPLMEYLHTLVNDTQRVYHQR